VAAGSLVLSSLSPADADGQTALLTTPEEVLATEPGVFITLLKTSRPQPVPSQEKARVVAFLPSEGVVTRLNRGMQTKLTALEPLLRVAERDAVYDVRVVENPFARIVIYERTVLLISKTVLALLSAEDLRAQVAHEMGHEYFAAEYERATKARDARRLKDLELMCDAVGIVLLHELGLDPSRLIKGVETVTLYNRRTSQKGMDESNYPTLDERRKFAAAVGRWIERDKGKGKREKGR
jgi:predicted Zn-dependent protease